MNCAHSLQSHACNCWLLTASLTESFWHYIGVPYCEGNVRGGQVGGQASVQDLNDPGRHLAMAARLIRACIG